MFLMLFTPWAKILGRCLLSHSELRLQAVLAQITICELVSSKRSRGNVR
jgi:hypothetical protein